MRHLARIVIFGLAAACVAVPIAAQESETERLFTVFAVEMDVTAATAAQARRIALKRARQQAFERLVGKIASPDALGVLPSISGEMLEQIVRAVQISNERSSSTRYLAEIDVTFSPPAIRGLLSDAGVAFTESLGGPYLLLPLYRVGGQLRLTGEHPWARAFEDAEIRNRLIRYRFPEAGIRTRTLLSPLRLDGASPATLAEIARRFDVSDTLLAVARPAIDFATGRLAVEFRGSTGPEAGIEVQGRVIAGAEEDLPILLERAADRILAAVDTAWKERTLISDQQRHRIEILAPVRHLEDWIALRKRLESVPVLRNAEIVRISLPLSRFVIDYVGSMEQLRLGLEQARLVLDERGERYILRPREQAEEIAARQVQEAAQRSLDAPRDGEGPAGEPAGDGQRDGAGQGGG